MPQARITVTLEELTRLRADARGFSFLPRQPVASLLAGRHASRLRGRGLAFEELRRYQQGDDVRSIDWRATARLRAPHVRVYSEERERLVLLVIDQRCGMFFGSRRAMKSVAAAELAALAAWRTVDAGDRVGAIVFNDAELVELRPERSRTRVLRLLHEVERQNRLLAEREPPAGDRSLNEALQSAARLAHHDHLVVLISDLAGADDESRRIATRIQAHNDLLVIAVYDPLGAALRSRPGMAAVSAGERLELPLGSGFERAFQGRFAELVERWVSAFRSLRIPILPISTAQPVSDQLREHFGQRARA